MKYFTILCFTVAFYSLSFSQTWIPKASLPTASSGLYPFCFSIGGRLYVGGGLNNGTVYNSLYEYNPTTNVWTPKASAPIGVYGDANFVINGKGYIVCGKSATSLTTGVYMYDPTTNVWTTKNSFPGTHRQNTIGFSLNGKGYLMGGFLGGSNVGNDMWEYDPIADSWTQKLNVPGPGRDGPTALVINNQAYVGLGSDVSAATYYSDFYRFDPSSNTYTQVANSPLGRNAPAHFTLGGYGYIGLGSTLSPSVSQDFTRYDPVANTWTQIGNFGGAARGWPFSDTVAGVVYVGAGSDLINNIYRTDVWAWNSCIDSFKLGNDTTLCSPSTLTLLNNNSGASFLWSTGAVDSSIQVNTAGSYWLQVTKGVCIYRDTINISIRNLPSAFSIGNDTSYCGSFARTLSTGNPNTHWSTATTAASVSASAPGLYWAEISNSCGSARDSIVISQNPLPTVNLGQDTSLCSGSSLTLADTTSGASFLWNTNAVSSSISVTGSGRYWLQVTQNNCSKRDTINVSFVNPPSAFSIGNDTSYCGSFARTLSTGNPNTHWSTATTAASVSASAPGLYWAEISNSCGSTRDSIMISQNPLPTVNLGQDTSLCNGSSLTLADTTSGASFLWNTNAVSSSISVTGSGRYWLQVTQNNCSKRDTINVSFVNPPSAFSIGSDTSYCESFVRTLSTGNPNTHWSTATTASAISASTSGLYWAEISNSCGSVRDSIMISQNPLPTVAWTQPDTTHWNGTCLIEALTGVNPTGGHFSGPFVSRDSIILPHSVDSTFRVVYTYNDMNGCSNSTSHLFTSHICDGISETLHSPLFSVYPNPNTGTFTLETSHLQGSDFIIFDMLGQIVKKQIINSESESVDLRSAPEGIYTLTLTDKNESIRFIILR